VCVCVCVCEKSLPLLFERLTHEFPRTDLHLRIGDIEPVPEEPVYTAITLDLKVFLEAATLEGLCMRGCVYVCMCVCVFMYVCV
jgi:hypothetical protein